MGACLESYPVQCSAKLLDLTNDKCETLFFDRALFSLESLDLNTRYYSGATIRIKGGSDTSATVVLPEFS